MSVEQRLRACLDPACHRRVFVANNAWHYIPLEAGGYMIGTEHLWEAPEELIDEEIEEY